MSIINSLSRLFSTNNPIQHYKDAFEYSSDLVLFLNRQFSVIWFNKAFDSFCKEYSINNINDLIADRTLKDAFACDKYPYYFNFTIGSLNFQCQFFSLSADTSGNTFVMVCSIINCKKTIDNLTYIDPITGIGNVTLSAKTVNDFFTQRQLSACSKMLIVGIELSDFDKIDYFYGHTTGDNILTSVAQALQNFYLGNIICRPSGSNLMLMHRFEDDDFDVSDYVDQVVDILKNPIYIDDNNSVSLIANVGVITLPQDAHNRDDAMKNLKLAYQKARKGKDKVSVVFYNQSLSEETTRKLIIEKKLKDVIKNNHLKLVYQPKLDLKTEQIYGFEALLRWHDLELGFISPLDFISIAEDTGQIIPIGKWVLEQVCLQSNEWQKQGHRFKISLNVSIRQLQDPNFIDLFKSVIDETGVDISLIELEITESILSEGSEGIIELFKQIKQMGFTISLDDFGTKYSSLSYLTNIPIDILKIDRSFIMNACENPKDTAIVKTVITLAKELNLRVVAEGVETIDQANLLRTMECDYVQGYYYYKPMNLADVDKLLAEIK